MAGGTILCGSGAQRSGCKNGHVWKSPGWGKPFVVVTDEEKGTGIMTAIDEKSFHIARELAHQHTRRGWFESKSAALVREIRLRTAIYVALRAAKGEPGRMTATVDIGENHKRKKAPPTK